MARLSFSTDSPEPGAKDKSHIFELVMTDKENTTSAPDSVTVTVEAPIAEPVAEVRPEPTPFPSGGEVTLDGSGFSPGWRKELAFAWTRTEETERVTVELNGAYTATPSFMAAPIAPGAPDVIHVFTQTVTD